MDINRKIIVITFFALISLFACDAPKSKEVKSIATEEVSNLCTANAVCLLQNTEGRNSFFAKLDSVLQIQYPKSDNLDKPQDITADLLTTFFKDLDTASFYANNTFSKEYAFDTSNVKSLKNRKSIELTFDESTCSFRLVIINYYETEEYSDESSIVYSFSIADGKITSFVRQEAG